MSLGKMAHYIDAIALLPYFMICCIALGEVQVLCVIIIYSEVTANLKYHLYHLPKLLGHQI